MTVEERIEAADRRKLEGNDYFKEKKFEEAMQQYEMVSDLLYLQMCFIFCLLEVLQMMVFYCFLFSRLLHIWETISCFSCLGSTGIWLWL